MWYLNLQNVKFSFQSIDLIDLDVNINRIIVDLAVDIIDVELVPELIQIDLYVDDEPSDEDELSIHLETEPKIQITLETDNIEPTLEPEKIEIDFSVYRG
jgi:hypothetical protein